jgi:hypothetical protein
MGIKNKVLGGLAGLAMAVGGAGDARGALVGQNAYYYLDDDNPKKTHLGWTFIAENEEEKSNMYFNYKVDLWNKTTDEYLGSYNQMSVPIDNHLGIIDSEIPLYPILKDVNDFDWQPNEGLRARISPLPVQLKNKGSTFEPFNMEFTHQGYETGESEE